MKIKLVTFAPHPNFGTCLQSFALFKVLRDMGHDVEFLYNGRESYPYGVKKILKKVFRKIGLKPVRPVTADGEPMPHILSLPDSRVLLFLSRIPLFRSLWKKYLCRTIQRKKVFRFTFEDGNYKMRRLFTRRQYGEAVADADLLVVGSDQVWNPYCGGFNPLMFLEDAPGKKKISYSSSISRPVIPFGVKERMRRDLSDFSHISVRERKSVELLGELLGRDDIKLVCDPTFLLPRKDWEDFGKRAETEIAAPSRYIFCYFIGDKHKRMYEKIIQEVKELTGVQEAIALDCYERDLVLQGAKTYGDAGPYEWVSLLSGASYVCTDSFHATLFSLKFHKDFVTALKDGDADAGSQNTRMYDLLGRYSLSHKLYDGRSDGWKTPPDWDVADSVAAKEVRSSLEYLQNSIEK